MFRKTFYWTVLTALILSACGGGQPPVTALSSTAISPPTTDPATKTPLPPATSTPVPPLTAAPAIPTFVNAPDCTDSAAFIVDVTVPDNTQMPLGETFNKIWRIKNTGTCTWTSAYTLHFKKGDQMDSADSMELPGETSPGASLDISVSLEAPNAGGIYRGDFVIQNPAGQVMPIDKETTLWVIIQVGNATAVPGGAGGGVTVTPTGGGGLVISTCAYTVSAVNTDAVVAAINSYRASNGLPAYTVNPLLTKAAQAHSADMACNNLFTHAGSDGSSPASRVAAAGYSASEMSENVYGSYPPPNGQGAVTWWATDQVDPRHNENLLSTQYTEIGVGYSFFNNYGYYVVDFAAP
jgi:uncharacterized protein YkwD